MTREKNDFKYHELRAVSQLHDHVPCKRYLSEGMGRCGCDFFVVKINLINGERRKIPGSGKTHGHVE